MRFAQQFEAAGPDRQARRSRVVSVALVVAVGGLMAAVAVDSVGERPWYATVLAVVAALVAVAAVWSIPAGRPVAYVLEPGRLRIVRRWRRDRLLSIGREAERFRDGEALRRCRFYGTGRPIFSRVAGLALGLGAGRLTYALTDRDRAVLVDAESGWLLVSPADPEAFVAAITAAAGSDRTAA